MEIQWELINTTSTANTPKAWLSESGRFRTLVLELKGLVCVKEVLLTLNYRTEVELGISNQPQGPFTTGKF